MSLNFWPFFQAMCTPVGDPIPVGSLPQGIAYEPVHERMYVTNFGSDSVSVIQMPQEVDPVTAIRDLIFDVRTLSGVNFDVKATLMTQLRLALNIVSDNNPSNNLNSCALMNAFTTSVNTFQSQGLLTAAQATDLLQQAQQIKNTIGCTSTM